MATGPVVSGLVDDNPDRLALVEYHANPDGYDTAWGQERAEAFYGAASALPFLAYDGSYSYPPEDFGWGLEQRLGESTDVTIALSGAQVQGAEWQITAVVCVEPGGRDKGMRVYTAQLLDHFPNPPDHSRNCFRQAAPTVDVEVAAGTCATVTGTIVLDSASAADTGNVSIVAWAQEPASAWPAQVYQAAQMRWPFPNSEPAEPELPRELTLPVPLFTAAGSAWGQDATTAAVAASSAAQVQATYRVLCGDTTGLHPSGQASAASPFATVARDEHSLPVFVAGDGEQQVLLCDYGGERTFPSSKWGVASEGGPVPVPACDGTVRPSGPTGTEAEGHLVLFDAAAATAYDFWQATTDRQGECQSRGGGRTGTEILEAGRADFAALHGEGANPRGVPGARPSGIPLLAGALLPEDVASGVVAHALAVALPGPRNSSPDPAQPLDEDVLYPAAGTDFDHYSTNPDALACGQRLRLRSSLVDADGRPLDESAAGPLAPITRMVLAALRAHGAYVVGHAPTLTLYAEDVHTAVLDLAADDVNRLVGQPVGMPLPAGKTKWQTVVDRLQQDLSGIPFAQGTCAGPSSVVVTANFEVVEPVADPHACTAPAITGQPEGATAPPGASVTLTVTATGSEPLAYQWYEGVAGDSSSPVAGATAASFTTPPLDASATFWVRVSNDCGEAASDAATITVTSSELPFAALLPAVSHAPGAGGTLWRTDVAAVNPGSEPATVELRFLPSSGGEGLTASLGLAAGAAVEWGNVLESVFGLAADAVASGSVAVASSAPLVAVARTYNQTPGGTYGQSLPALPHDAVELVAGRVGHLVGLKKSADYRTNLGLASAAEEGAAATVRLLDAAGAQLGGPLELELSGPGWRQVNDLFAAVGAQGQDVAHATVAVSRGAAWAYASVVDNRSGDGTTVPVLVAAGE